MKSMVMLCGIDCHHGDKHCNGYCIGKSKQPPAATEEMVLTHLKHNANNQISKAEAACYEYACELPVGDVRTKAFEVYENIRTARRVG